MRGAAALAALGVLLRTPSGAAAPRHDLHLTYSRVVVEGGHLQWRVRLFRDDLARALAARGAPVTLGTPPADRALAALFAAQVRVVANGRPLALQLRESAADPEEGDAPMWSVTLEGDTPTPVTSLAVWVGLLFDRFDDQRNLVTVVRRPGETRASLFFAASDPPTPTAAW